MLGDVEIIPWILDKFARHGWWGARHTNFENIPKGAPQHMRAKIKETTKYLIKIGFLVQKPTSYGLELSLNLDMKNEIFDIIRKWKLDK